MSSLRTMFSGVLALSLVVVVGDHCHACHWLRACHQNHQSAASLGGGAVSGGSDRAGDPVPPGSSGGDQLGDPVIPGGDTPGAGTGATPPGTNTGPGTGSDPMPPAPTNDLTNPDIADALQEVHATYDALDERIGKIRLVENQRHILNLIVLPQAERAAYIKKNGLEGFLAGD